MLKKMLITVVVLLAIIGGGVFYLGSNLDSIIKSAVEKVGSAATKAEVKLGDVKITLTDGKGTLSKLSIGNPVGFTTPRAFYLGSITIQIDPKSITGNGPVIINKIDIEKPQITYEVTAGGESNLQALAKNAKSFTGPTSEGKAESTTAKESKETSRKVIINDLYIREGQIGISHALLQGKAMATQMPTVHLTNIGKDKGGVTPAQVAEMLLGIVSNSAAQAANIDIKKEIGSLKSKAIDNVSQKLMGVFGK